MHMMDQSNRSSLIHPAILTYTRPSLRSATLTSAYLLPVNPPSAMNFGANPSYTTGRPEDMPSRTVKPSHTLTKNLLTFGGERELWEKIQKLI